VPLRKKHHTRPEADAASARARRRARAAAPGDTKVKTGGVKTLVGSAPRARNDMKQLHDGTMRRREEGRRRDEG